MANVLTSASAAPTAIPSGGKTTLRVTCEVSNSGKLTVSGTAGFDLDYQPRDLEVGDTSKEVEVKITRKEATNQSCDLVLAFRGSTQPTTVKVT